MGNPTTVTAGTKTLVTNSYEARTGKLLESTYGNGHKVANFYDRFFSVDYNVRSWILYIESLLAAVALTDFIESKGSGKLEIARY